MAKIYADREIKIEDILFPNKGTGKILLGDGEERVVAVKNTLPGQSIVADVKRKKGGYEGRLKSIIARADYECAPECDRAGECGGCTYQTISYEKESEIKRKMVLDLLHGSGITDFEYEGLVSSPIHTKYRNKMEFSFGDNGADGELCLGVRKRNSNYEVVNADQCMIVHEDIRRAVGCVVDHFRESGEKFYHRFRHDGTLRHLLVRRGHFTGEMLLCLVTTSELSTDLMPLADKLRNLELEGELTGFCHIVNDGLGDVVKADSMKLLYGRDHIYDMCLGLKFKITPFSFFQTNSAGAEVLYSVVRDFAGDFSANAIYDLYCGTGTITQLLSKNAKKVVGIEIVEEAVEAARVNTKLNGISNCEFIAGDVLNMIDELTDKPELIILDPPREGINAKAIPKICAFDADRLIYISCKASSLAKDLLAFESYGYKVEKIKNVDMFPRTYHVETVCLLTHKC